MEVNQILPAATHKNCYQQFLTKNNLFCIRYTCHFPKLLLAKILAAVHT